MHNIMEYMRWTRTTVKYPLENEGEYLHNGLIAEVGEFYGNTAKYHRCDYDSDEWKRRAQLELGDIFWFLVRYCDYLEIPVDEVLALNVEKLEGRLKKGSIKGADNDDGSRTVH